MRLRLQPLPAALTDMNTHPVTSTTEEALSVIFHLRQQESLLLQSLRQRHTPNLLSGATSGPLTDSGFEANESGSSEPPVSAHAQHEETAATQNLVPSPQENADHKSSATQSHPSDRGSIVPSFQTHAAAMRLDTQSHEAAEQAVPAPDEESSKIHSCRDSAEPDAAVQPPTTN